MGGKTGLVWDDGFINYNLGPYHPLRPGRVKLTHDLIRAKKILDDNTIEEVKARTATRDEIQLFHDDSYVRLVEQYSRKGSGLLDAGDTPAFKGCYEATSLVVGASLEAADNVMNGRLSHCFNPSGGLHHAHPERASGFCIFNDPAIVISYLKTRFKTKRLVYLDIDAHHGDGVMYGYYEDPAVLDIDFHESGNFFFPGTGFPDEIGKGEAKGLKLNIPLPPATGDQAYLEAFRDVLPEAVRRFKPEIILIQCGADGHLDDRLAHLRLTTNVYSEMIREMHHLAHEMCNGRLLLFGGGGYTLSNVPRVWTLAFATLANKILNDEIPPKWAQEFRKSAEEDPPEKLHDIATTDTENTMKQVRATLAELHRNLADNPQREP
ncbi:MAG TPA: acetoin utilization protein AcuC [Candidatus Dormibacteraeota bacterium]|nr:acetoin utilization protein AcuC [Candidatus Dormibacteraeota bacterium]